MFHTVNNEIVRFEVSSHNVIRDDVAPFNRSRTGYGKKLSTSYRVRVFDNKWRRVYCACYSNSGTCYIISGGKRFVVSF